MPKEHFIFFAILAATRQLNTDVTAHSAECLITGADNGHRDLQAATSAVRAKADTTDYKSGSGRVGFEPDRRADRIDG